MMAERKTRIKTGILYAIFSIVTFLSFLLLMEGGIRLFFSIKNSIEVRERSFSDYLGWETDAYVSSRYHLNGYGEIKYSTQEYGFRVFGDVGTDKTKILVIGDSFTWGRTVSDGNTYYDYLSKHNNYAEIFAYGGGGYGTLQEFMILDKYFDVIKPDIILWQFCTNDIINNSHELESASLYNNNQMTRPYYRDGEIEWLFPTQYRRWLHKLVASSYLLRLLNIRLNILASEKVGSIEDEFSPEHFLFRNSMENTSKIMALVKERVGDTLVVAFSLGGWENTFKEISQRNSIPFIVGVDDAILRAKASGLTVDGAPHDTHWNSYGHSIVGALILGFLKKNNYLIRRDRSKKRIPPPHRDILGKYRPSLDGLELTAEKLKLTELNSSNSKGFGHMEGPYPQWNMPNKVRWMVAPQASFNFFEKNSESSPLLLRIRVLTPSTPQLIEAFIDEKSILKETLDSANTWSVFSSKPVVLKEGRHVLTFKASSSESHPGSSKPSYILFDELTFAR